MQLRKIQIQQHNLRTVGHPAVSVSSTAKDKVKRLCSITNDLHAIVKPGLLESFQSHFDIPRVVFDQ
jgi:hypothetical protein